MLLGRMIQVSIFLKSLAKLRIEKSMLAEYPFSFDILDSHAFLSCTAF